VASVGLLIATGPKVSTKEPYHVAMASLASFSTIGNSVKVYQQWNGKPREYAIKK